MLNKAEPPEARAYLFERLLPFELEVMQTRLKYWAGDHMGYLDALSALLRKCKVNASKQSPRIGPASRAGGAGGRIAAAADPAALAMWQERGARVALIIASQMVEMKVSILLYFFTRFNEHWLITTGTYLLGIHGCSAPS